MPAKMFNGSTSSFLSSRLAAICGCYHAASQEEVLSVASIPRRQRAHPQGPSAVIISAFSAIQHEK